eukprot:COSAG01_NODE_33131_length_569_cov_11.538298_1_plen_71_part_00
MGVITELRTLATHVGANMHPFYTATLLCCALPLMQEKLVAEKKKTADLESKLAAATVRDRTLPHTAVPQA